MTNKEIVELLLRELKLLRGYAPLYVKHAWENGVDVKHPLNMTHVNNVINIAQCHLATRPTKAATNANIRFEDWEAEQMRGPEFRAAIRELEPEYQAARYRQALEEIAGLAKMTQTRGEFEQLNTPDHLIDEDGWGPIHPRVLQSLKYAARIAQRALGEAVKQIAKDSAK